MDNYDRTMELVDLAQNSAGQSSIQFRKTLDSLETKINQLSNAFQQFYIQFINSDFFKGLIDSATVLIQRLNELPPLMSVIMIAFSAIAVKNVISSIIGSFSSATKSFYKIKSEIEKNKIKVQMETNLKQVENDYNDWFASMKIKINDLWNYYTKRQAEATNPNYNSSFIGPENYQKGISYVTPISGNYTSNSSSSTPASSIDSSSNVGSNMRVGQALKNAFSSKNVANALKTSLGGATRDAIIIGTTTGIASKDVGEGIKNALLTFGLEAIPSVISKVLSSSGAIKAIGSALTGALSAAAPALIAFAASFAAVAIPVGITYYFSPEERSKRSLEEATKEYEENLSKLEEIEAETTEMQTEYQNLDSTIERYKELEKIAGRNNEEQEEFLDLSNEIANLAPELVQNYDSMGNAILKSTDYMDELLEKQKELLNLQKQKDAAQGIQTAISGVRVEEENLDQFLQENPQYIEGWSSSAALAFEQDSSRENYEALIEEFKNNLQLLIDERTAAVAAGLDDQADMYQTMIDKYQKQIDNMKSSLYKFDYGMQSYAPYGVGKGATWAEGGWGSSQFVQTQENTAEYNELIANRTKAEELLRQQYTEYADAIIEALMPEQDDIEVDIPIDNLEIMLQDIITSSMSADQIEPAVAGMSAEGEQFEKIEKFLNNEGFKGDIEEENEKGEKVLTEEAAEFYNNYINETYGAIVDSFFTMTPELQNIVATKVGELEGMGASSLNEVVNYIQTLEGVPDEIKRYFENQSEYIKGQIKTFLRRDVFKGLDTKFLENFSLDFLQSYADTLDELTPEGKAEATSALYTLDDIYNISGSPELQKIISGIEPGDFEGLAEAIKNFSDITGQSIDVVSASLLNYAHSLDRTPTSSLSPQVAAQEWSDLAASINSVIDSYEGLASAIQEVNENGSLSIETALSLIEAGQIEALQIDETTGALTINKEAAEESFKAQIALKKAQIDANKAELETNLAAVKAQKDALDAQIQILEAKINSGESLTTEEVELMRQISANGLIDINADTVKLTDRGTQIFAQSALNNLEVAEGYRDNLIKIGQQTYQGWVDAQSGQTVAAFEAGDYSDIKAFSEFQSVVDSAESIWEELLKTNNETREINTEEHKDELIQILNSYKEQSEIYGLTIQSLEGQISQAEKVSVLLEHIMNTPLENLDGSQTKAMKEELEQALEDLQEIYESLDRFYNLLKDIENLENNADLLDTKIDLSTNAEERANLILQQMQNSVNLQAKYSEAIGEYTKEQQRLQGELSSQFGNIVYFEDGILRQNTEEILSLSKEEYDVFTDLVSKYEETEEAVRNYNDSLLEQKEVQEELILEQYEAIQELEDYLRDLLIQQDQDYIEQVKERYEKIKQEDEDYLSSVRENVDKIRKERDKLNKQEDLQEQRNKLARLRMDTSGANNLAILELEEEIRQAEQDMADEEVDDYLDSLEEQFNASAERMDKEIEYMEESQKRKEELQIEYNQEIKNIMRKSTEEIIQIITEMDTEFKGMTEAAQQTYMDNITKMVTKAKAGAEALQQGLEDIDTETVKTSVVTAFDAIKISVDNMTNSIQTAIDKIKDWNDTDPEGKTFKAEAEIELPDTYFTSSGGRYAGSLASIDLSNRSVIYDLDGTPYLMIGDGYYAKNPNIDPFGNYYITRDTYLYKKKYASGGLVDYTGPAWVDGSTSRPEAFLSPSDTENIAKLRDVLATLFTTQNRSNLSSEEVKNGTYNYEIHIEVERAQTEKDVENLMILMEKKINEISRGNGITAVKRRLR